MLYTLNSLGIGEFETAILPKADDCGNYHMFTEEEMKCLLGIEIPEQAKHYIFSLGIRIDSNGDMYMYGYIPMIGMNESKPASLDEMVESVTRIDPSTVIVFQQLDNGLYRLVTDEVYELAKFTVLKGEAE